MKKICVILSILFFCVQAVFADEDVVTEDNTAANQEITATENKAVIAVQKCPLNENANQKIILKKNWFVVFVQVNGKVKVNPANVEVE